MPGTRWDARAGRMIRIPESCDHCGRRLASGHARGSNGERLCHPDNPGLPDCARRVAAGEILGALKGIGQPPPGVTGITEEARS
jgi:hypothetical protein